MIYITKILLWMIVCRIYCRLDSEESLLDHKEMLLKYLRLGQDNDPVYTEKCERLKWRRETCHDDTYRPQRLKWSLSFCFILRWQWFDREIVVWCSCNWWCIDKLDETEQGWYHEWQPVSQVRVFLPPPTVQAGDMVNLYWNKLKIVFSVLCVYVFDISFVNF